MRNKRTGWLIIIFCAVGLGTSCVPGIQPTEQIDNVTLVPFKTMTQEIYPTFTPENTLTPAPTPTVQIYSIKENDNLTSLSKRFSVSLEAILAANPNLIPEALIIGQTIIIPSEDQSSVSGLSGTPVPIEISQGRCFVMFDGTVCILTVSNPSSQDITNLLVECSLLDSSQNILSSQEETIPFEILPAGSALPVLVRYADKSGSAINSRTISAAIIDPSKNTHQLLIPDNLQIVKTWDGLSASVKGSVTLGAGIKSGSIRLLALSEDKQGEIIGINKKDIELKLAADQPIKFEMAAYSLGPLIDNIKVMIEYSP